MKLDVSNIDISSGLSIALWALFAVAMVLFAGASLVLLYHWRTYGISNRQVVTAEVVYLSVSAALIVISLIFLNLI